MNLENIVAKVAMEVNVYLENRNKNQKQVILSFIAEILV